MAETAKQRQERSLKELFVGKCWKYLDDNFHKFVERDRIKIALTLCTKDIPQEVTGDLTHKIMQMPTIEKGNRLLEYNIGNN